MSYDEVGQQLESFLNPRYSRRYMDIGEEVAEMKAFMTSDPLCREKEEPENQGWQCRIGKPGSPGDLELPTARRLYENMNSPSVPVPVFIPSSPPRKEGHWDLNQCSQNSFPFQSHHLIPKMHLPKKKVCVWLAKGAANSEWALTESTNYDTDNARNGMALPFASNTYQWKQTSNAAEQELVCNKMMKLTGRQLHQGSHTYEDYGEEDRLHAKEQPGYLGAVDELLEVVHGQTFNHVMLCEDCNKKDSPPRKIRPLERVVISMYQVSHLMEGIITKNKRFVSLKAAKYFGLSKIK